MKTRTPTSVYITEQLKLLALMMEQQDLKKRPVNIGEGSTVRGHGMDGRPNLILRKKVPPRHADHVVGSEGTQSSGNATDPRETQRRPHKRKLSPPQHDPD